MTGHEDRALVHPAAEGPPLDEEDITQSQERGEAATASRRTVVPASDR